MGQLRVDVCNPGLSLHPLALGWIHVNGTARDGRDEVMVNPHERRAITTLSELLDH